MIEEKIEERIEEELDEKTEEKIEERIEELNEKDERNLDALGIYLKLPQEILLL